MREESRRAGRRAGEAGAVAERSPHAQIRADGANNTIGRFDSEDDAARAYDAAARASGRADRLSLLNFPTVAEQKRLDKPRSGYRGVSWSTRDSKWLVQIYVDGASRYVGRFDDEEDAARAYDVAARSSGRSAARSSGRPDRLSLLNFPTAAEQKRLDSATAAEKKRAMLPKPNSTVPGTSRDVGVFQSKRKNYTKWTASIQNPNSGTATAVGNFDDEDEAARAYDAAAREQRDGQAYDRGQGLRNRLNFPTEEAGLVRLVVADERVHREEQMEGQVAAMAQQKQQVEETERKRRKVTQDCQPTQRQITVDTARAAQLKTKEDEERQGQGLHSEYFTMKIRVSQSLAPGSISKIMSPDGQTHFVRVPQTDDQSSAQGGRRMFVKRLPRQYQAKHLRELHELELAHWMNHRKIERAAPNVVWSEPGQKWVFSDGLGLNLLRSEEWLKQPADNLMSI